MRREVFVIVVVVVLAIVAGITSYFYSGGNLSEGSSVVADNSLAAVEVPFTQITEGLQSGVTERVNYLITSTADLEALWKMVKAAGAPPAIDFSKEAVIAIFAGEKPTAGHSIAVSKVEDLDSTKRLVTVTLMQPAPDCVTAQVQTTPYEVAKIPITSLPLTHEDTKAIINCSE